MVLEIGTENPFRELITKKDLEEKNKARKAKGIQVIIPTESQRQISLANPLDVLAVTTTMHSPLTIVDVKKIETPEAFCKILFNK